MNEKSENLLTSILNSSQVLKKFSKKFIEIDKLNSIIQEVLNPELKEHCTVSNIKKDTLILTTTNPVWKHQLRFWQPVILEYLSKYKDFKRIKKIKTKIDKINYKDLVRKNSNTLLKKPFLSPENANILLNTAELINQGGNKNNNNNKNLEKLAKSLKNLAKHAAAADVN